MAPYSKSEMGCEPSNDLDIINLTDKLLKCDLKNDKSEVYEIDDDEVELSKSSTEDLQNCSTVKEKLPTRTDKINTRYNPLNRNYIQDNNLNPVLSFNNADYYDLLPPPPPTTTTTTELLSFSFNNPSNDFSQLIEQLCEDHLTYPDNQSPSTSDYSSDSVGFDLNIPATIENIPTTIEQNYPSISINAEKSLSIQVDENKRLKQDIWILVNMKTEDQLIRTLKTIISSGSCTQTDVTYIYAIIFRLMRDKDGQKLLRDYFHNDTHVLFKVAIKQNILLMKYILEVFQKVGRDPSQVDLLYQLINYPQINSYYMLDALLNVKFMDKTSLYIFDVNKYDVKGQNILMCLLENISLNQGDFQINLNYLDLILSHNPDITHKNFQGKNVLHFAFQCGDEIMQKMYSHCDLNTLEFLRNQSDIYGMKPCTIQELYLNLS